MNDDMVTIQKVVSKNFVFDFWAKIQNLIGENLSSYEKMVGKGIDQIKEELKEKNIVMSWFRFETTQLTNGAVLVLMYGEKK